MPERPLTVLLVESDLDQAARMERTLQDLDGVGRVHSSSDAKEAIDYGLADKIVEKV